MPLFLLLLAVLLLPLPTLAVDWVKFSARELSEYFMDKGSIYHQSDNHYRVWVRRENTWNRMSCKRKHDEGCKKMAVSEQKSCEVLTQNDCPTGTEKDYVSMYLYEISCTGQIRALKDENGEHMGEWSYIQPDSMEGELEKLVCQK